MVGMTKRLIGAKSVAMLFSLSLLVVSCREPSYQHEKVTLSRMRMAAEVVGTVIEEKLDDPFRYSSYDEAIRHWRKRGWVSSALIREDEKDAWGKEYYWELVIGETRKVVRIISAGRNGERENGDGDDVYIDVIVFPDGKLELKSKPLDQIKR